MLLDAAETTLGIFGFDRTLYGKPKDKKCWMELRRNKMKDVEAEAGVRWASQSIQIRIQQVR